MYALASPLIVTFTAGASGAWQIDTVQTVIGEGLPLAARLAIREGSQALSDPSAAWTVRGVTSNARYSLRAEVDAMQNKQEQLRRVDATHAALIPIRKTSAWWALAQDERRAIFEDQSRHIATGMDYLPAVARRLHHSREMGEPFDFLTWFEYAPHHSDAFDDMLRRMRATKEWDYVDREVDIRLTRLSFAQLGPLPVQPSV